MGDWIPSVMVGIALSIPGLALWAFAEELDVFPFVGFRIAYTTVSKDLWRRMNKISGAVLGSLGLSSIPFGILLGPLWEILFYAISVSVAVIVLIEYARSQAEIESIRAPAQEEGPLKPIDLRTSLKLVVIVVTTLSITFLSASLRDVIITGAPPEMLLAFVPYFMLATYMCYLSVLRPESYGLPWIKEDGVRVLAVAVPLSVSLIGIAISLLMFGRGLYGILILTASFIVLFLAFITQLEMPKNGS